MNTMPVGVSKFKGNVSAQYSLPLDSGIWAVRTGYTYQSRVWFDVPNNSYASQGAYGLLNLRLSWNSNDGRWGAAFNMSNALNKQYYSLLDNSVTLWGTEEGQVGTPRFFMFTLRRSFGG